MRAQLLVLLALLGTALYWDLRWRRIPNALCLGSALLAVLLFTAQQGLAGSAHALAGLAVGFGLFLPLYWLGGMAAGDVKLMAAAGSLLGPNTAMWAVLLTLISGLVIGLLWLAVYGGLRNTMSRYWLSLRLKQYVPPLPADDPALQRFPYSLAVLSGCLLSSSRWLL